MAAVMYAPGFPSAVLPTDLNKIVKSQGLLHDSVQNALLGAVVGGNLNISFARLAITGGNNESFAGKVTVETVTNTRATTATDLANLKLELRQPRPTLAFPKDLSGNGGPAYTRT
jgi:hypothetical protein